MTSPLHLWVLLVVQAGCALFFAFDAVLDLMGRPGIGIIQAVEYVATIALLGGVLLTFHQIRRLSKRQSDIEDRLAAVSGAFADMLDAQFADWALTEAERDVALLTIKGLSIAEIAELRGGAQGTVKSHSASIYRKAGVTGRTQLLSFFIEDLMAEPLSRQGIA